MNRSDGGIDGVSVNIDASVPRHRDAAELGSAVHEDRYPDEEYLSALDPGFGSFVRVKVERPIAELGDRVGSLTAEAAEWTGLREGTAVGAGNDVMRRSKHGRRQAVAA